MKICKFCETGVYLETVEREEIQDTPHGKALYREHEKCTSCGQTGVYEFADGSDYDRMVGCVGSSYDH